MRNFSDPLDCIQYWLGWCRCDGFISEVLYAGNETNIRYLLKEIERARTALHDLHKGKGNFPRNISTGAVALEHIFAQNIDAPGNQKFPGFPAYGITDRGEYERDLLWRSGNVTWLSETANTALGNKTPEDKAAHYQNCPEHPPGTGENNCSDIVITQEAGAVMVGLGLHQPSLQVLYRGPLR